MGNGLFTRRTKAIWLDIELNKMLDFEAAQLLAYMNSEHADLIKQINDTGDYNDDIGAQLQSFSAIEKFKW